MEATKTALNRDPVVLIQGPPGTGKTRTILSLLSALLHAVPSSTKKTDIDFKHYAEMRESRPVMTAEEKRDAWSRAAPWMSGAMNPRDAPPSSALTAESRAGGAVDCVARVLGTKAYKRSKILICAPSNSALDEMVLRIMQNGLFDATGATYSPTLVRVGINVHHSVESVSMDTLVSQRVGVGVHVDSVRRFEAAVEREKLKQAILDEASVVCSTLSYSGAGMFSRMTKQFDAVIIDEAAQAIEPSTLIPLCHGAKQVFLVGDPRQLPATVLSNVAVANDYDMSMFNVSNDAAIRCRAQDAIQNAPRDSRVPVEILLRRRVEGWTGYDDAQRASLARVLGVSSLCVLRRQGQGALDVGTLVGERRRGGILRVFDSKPAQTVS